jgi:type IV pilus assembly protein PilM
MGLFGSNDITGVDIGAGSIKIVRMTTGKRPRLLSAEVLELPFDAAADGVGAGLVSLLTGKKIKGKKVVTQISGRHLTVRHLTLPRMPQADLREAVRWESKRFISYPLDDALIEYLIVGEKLEGAVEKFDLLMVAVPRASVVERVQPFIAAGLEVTAVDANALALRNVLRLRNIQGEDNVLVVDLGAGKTEINVYRDGNLRFSRYLETGGADITRAISELLGTGLQEAEEMKQKTDVLSPSEDNAVADLVRNRLDDLSLEIRRSLEYYKTTFREPYAERMILTGGGSLMSGITDYFSRTFEGKVERDAPFAALSSRKKILQQFEPIAPRLSAAVGLSLRRA